jgi:SAM-dependent methyltransferase
MQTGHKIKKRIAKSLLRSVGLDAQNLANFFGTGMASQEQFLLRMNSKVLAGHLAKERLKQVEMTAPVKPEPISLGWRATTEADLKSDWCRYWLGELKVDLRMHRKCWEYGWALQELFAANMLKEGSRGLGFGCGKEPLASYFAKRGIYTTITDLDPSLGKSDAWADTNQHASSLQDGHYNSLISWEKYQEMVSHRFEDMNVISEDLKDFDFCWSICSLEHLGSIDNGLDFIENSMKTLRPGGIAVHTTEFNCQSNENTVETGASVIFRQKDFEKLAERLRASGHKVGVIEFGTGADLFDQYVDFQPYDLSMRSAALRDYYGSMVQGGHLRMMIDGHVSTCFGLVIEAGF